MRTSLAVGAIFVGAVLLIRLRPPLGFLGTWFFLCLAPTSSFFPIADVAAEHRMYLPLAAVVTLIVIGGFEALGGVREGAAHWNQSRLWFARGLVLLASAIFGTMTYHRNQDYSSALVMWQDTVTKRPENSRAHNNLGMAVHQAGRLEEALMHYREAIRISPEHIQAHNNLGNALTDQGKLNDAVSEYVEALRLDPNYPHAYYNLGVVLHKQGRLREAISNYEKALAIEPHYEGARKNLQKARSEQNKQE